MGKIESDTKPCKIIHCVIFTFSPKTWFQSPRPTRMAAYYIGVDMGTSSCRAGLVTAEGTVVAQVTWWPIWWSWC